MQRSFSTTTLLVLFGLLASSSSGQAPPQEPPPAAPEAPQEQRSNPASEPQAAFAAKPAAEANASSQRKARLKKDRDRSRLGQDVVICYRKQPTKRDLLRLKNRSRLDPRAFKKLHMRTARLSERAIRLLSRDRNVAGVFIDEEVSSVNNKSARWAVNQPQAYRYLDGSMWVGSAGVAVVDSGVADHWDFHNVFQVDFITGRTSPWNPSRLYDPFGHGTHIAGLVHGVGWYSNDYRFASLAPNSWVVSLRVLDQNGRAPMSRVLEALDWILFYGQIHGIQVVNLSLGKGVNGPASFDPLVAAAERLWDAGYTVVASAGNYGRAGHFTVTSPGISPKIITVGSLTHNGTDYVGDDYPSTFSSRGPTLFDNYLKPDLLAPGNRLIAPMVGDAYLATRLRDRKRCDYYCRENGTQYLELSGTSMAAAMVSSAVALMLEVEPSLSPDSVKARLMRSAQKLQGDPTIVGAGLLDVAGALADRGTTHSALSPRLLPSATEPGTLLIENVRYLWGPSFSAKKIWGDGYAWSGSGPGNDYYLLSHGHSQADRSVWSDGYVWSNAYPWSDDFIEANSYPWSDHIGGESMFEDGELLDDP